MYKIIIILQFFFCFTLFNIFYFVFHKKIFNKYVISTLKSDRQVSKSVLLTCVIFLDSISISRRPNSWLRFRVQKLGILDTQIQMGVSQRVFIPSRASKCMLESKHKSFRKWKKIWSWATSFWSFGNFKKYAIYIFYIYALRGYSG